MKHPCLLALCSLLGLGLSACGGDSIPDPGLRTDDAQTVDPNRLLVTLRGKAELFPEAAQRLAAQGQPLPSLEGLSLVIEEPLRAGVNDPAASFGTGVCAEDGTFSITDVPVKDIHTSLAASLEHPGLAHTSTIVFDTAFTGSRPRTDITGAQAWALPLSFQDALTQSVGEEAIGAHTEGRARSLLDAGFILGRVVDAQGRPVAGARVQIEPGELADRLYYPSDDFTRADQDGTHGHGLFLYVHSGLGAEAFQLAVHGSEAYTWRNAGAMPHRGLVLTLHPGDRAP
ncbi:carboxypeptidase regulatory-like domain-containing protein [Stigmatella sp. ncwal1]|uniref:Carboxypeptidase regulatory-like domain-containing protein n=1 Tax=Stigmatella ashevillensis TaxID=2995309 RepID=A0ABT5DEB9_9BACT|nr:carboxypeptidase regulatory-like domain-containing protein [Stigmatella ashevillena]MDC0711463.1 carboxypeptidase regulatory-like domain-containing protein [Stigmatella ashevillena]